MANNVVKKIGRHELVAMINEEKKLLGFGPMRDVCDAADDAEEVEPGDLGKVFANRVDHLKALKLKEARLRIALKNVRSAVDRERALIERMRRRNASR